MRSGILQVLLAAIVLFQVVVSEKDSNKTETNDEKDIIKEETGQISFRMHPRNSGYDGSKSVSNSKSSSKSSGSGSGKGYGYGSNGPQDKGPQGGSYGGYRRPGYDSSYEDDFRGSSEGYKSSREEGSYHGGSHHRDSSPEYSTNYEKQYSSNGRQLPTYQNDKRQSKTYSGTSNRNRGYSSSSGRYDKNDDLPSVSPDGFIESHSNQQTSAEKFDSQEYGPQGYAGPKATYGGQSYQGYQGGPPLTSSHGYSEYSGRDEGTGYSGPSYGGFTPMLGGPKHEPYSNVIAGKDIDGENVSFFVKQLGGAALPEIQGKNSYISNDGKLGLGKGQQQGFLLFPVVPKGTEGGDTGYGGGRNAYNGVPEGKIETGLVKDSGYKGPAYASHQPERYGQQHQGREYGGSSGGYGSGGHQVENAAYQQGKGGYGQSHKVVREGKNVLAGTAGVYGGSGNPKQHGPSVDAGHPGQATYGISGGHGAGTYGDSAKYGVPVTDVKGSGHGLQYPVKSGAPVNEGYGYTIAGGAGDAYKNVGANAGGYGGSLTAKDYPRDYKGVVSFTGGQSGLYTGDVHGVLMGSQGKSGANYESSGPSAGVGYGTGHGKNYPTAGYVEGGAPRLHESGYGDVHSAGIEAPKDKKSKSVAIILQKQPLNVPSMGPISGFGPELDAQFKSPFKDYLGGSGFDFNYGSYGAGISDFGSGFKGRDSPSEFLHGLDGYGGGLTSFNYGNANTKFY